MHDITSDAVIIGVDTHKDAHVAVAINGLGARLATASFPVTSQGWLPGRLSSEPCMPSASKGPAPMARASPGR